MDNTADRMIWNRLKDVYHGMISRCYNESSVAFNRYGRRDIYVCNKWRDGFIFFFVDAVEPFKEYIREIGSVPEIDRIDNDGPYSPDNCRWIDRDGNMLNSTAWGDEPIDDRHKDLTYKFNDFSKSDTMRYIEKKMTR